MIQISGTTTWTNEHTGNIYAVVVSWGTDGTYSVTISGDQLDLIHDDPSQVQAAIELTYESMRAARPTAVDLSNFANSIYTDAVAACRFAPTGKTYESVSYSSDGSGASEVAVFAPDNSKILEMTNLAAGGALIEYFNPSADILRATVHGLDRGASLAQTRFSDGISFHGHVPPESISEVDEDLTNRTGDVYLYGARTGTTSLLSEHMVYSGTYETGTLQHEYEDTTAGGSVELDFSPASNVSLRVSYFSGPNEIGSLSQVDENLSDGTSKSTVYSARDGVTQVTCFHSGQNGTGTLNEMDENLTDGTSEQYVYGAGTGTKDLLWEEKVYSGANETGRLEHEYENKTDGTSVQLDFSPDAVKVSCYSGPNETGTLTNAEVDPLNGSERERGAPIDHPAVALFVQHLATFRASASSPGPTSPFVPPPSPDHAISANVIH